MAHGSLRSRVFWLEQAADGLGIADKYSFV
jgi:hypothetical protein